MNYIPLQNRHIFTISGEDAAHFLQGLITNDIGKVTETQSIYACMLTPQGKYLYDFFISLWQGKYILDAGTLHPETLLKKLKMYKLRSKVEIEQTDWKVFALIGENTLVQNTPGHTAHSNDAVYFTDPRHAKLGARVITDANWPEAQGFTAENNSQYEQLRMSLGVADGVADLKPEDSFPLQFGLEELNAIDFKKGCYVGQEVTARSKHRGSVKKSVFTVKGETSLPDYGSVITAGNSKIGEMLSSSGNIGLALIRLEDWEKASEANTVLSCGDQVVSVSSAH